MKTRLRKGAALIAFLFLALVINEVFVTPPVMAGGALPDLAGAWTDGNTRQFEIDEHGRVSGAVSGKVYVNRSWFGEWMNLRSPYLIQGVGRDLKPVRIPFHISEGKIEGAFAVGPDYKTNQAHMTLRRVEEPRIGL